MNNLYLKVIREVGINLIFTIIGAVLGYLFIPPKVAMFAPILVIIALIMTCFLRRAEIGMTMVYIIAAIMGIGTYPAIVLYTNQIGAALVIGCFIITCVIFFVISIYGYTTNKDFSPIGGFLAGALIALILASILGLFIHASMLQIAISVAGILIFMGYILYDSNVLMKQCHSEQDIPMVVLSLYLDFLNLFLQLLSLIAELKGDD